MYAYYQYLPKNEGWEKWKFIKHIDKISPNEFFIEHKKNTTHDAKFYDMKIKINEVKYNGFYVLVICDELEIVLAKIDVANYE